MNSQIYLKVCLTVKGYIYSVREIYLTEKVSKELGFLRNVFGVREDILSFRQKMCHVIKLQVSSEIVNNYSRADFL